MNIFYINTDPKTAAKELADDHVRKMQIESAQMCSTAHWETGGTAPYKRAHKNHPSTKWARESIHHYRWLIEHGLEICYEFKKRYGKSHKTKEVLLWLKQNEPNIPDNGFTPPPQCMPEEYKDDNTLDAYKKFYILDKVKTKKLNWKKLNNKPTWIK
tara:strand:+ start:1119 stop:1589 length:471 start_codon:yes stop_codon:yes gene_type:complete